MIRTAHRVALYARFSSDNQRSESIDAQVRAMKNYCKQNGYIIINTYIDEAKSATTDRRPAFQQMIADSREHIFDILLVHKLDRFARNRYDSAVYKRELKKNGVAVYSVLENLDDSPESIMMEAVLDGMNEYFSQNLAREVMKGMRETALQCKHTGGKPPLGYDVDPVSKKLVVNEQEAEAVRLIFSMYSEGYGYSDIIEKMHEKNYKTKKGQDFLKSSLYSILTNRKYQGTYIFNQSSAKDYNGRRNTHQHKATEDIIAIEGGCPQIVDTVVFNRVQARLQNNKNCGPRNHGKTNYLLSGKVYCRECGRAMAGNTRYSGRNGQLYSTYRCPSKRFACANKEINRNYLERYTIMLLEKHILNPKAMKANVKRIEKHRADQQKDGKDRVSELRKKLEETVSALNNVADAVAAGLLSDALVSRLEELEQQRADVEEELRVVEAMAEQEAIDAEAILAEYAALKATPSSPAYREFLQRYIERIEVGKYEVNIVLRTGLGLFRELDMTIPVRRQEIYERKRTS